MFFLSLITTIILLLNIHFIHNPWMGTILTAVYLLLLGVRLGKSLPRYVTQTRTFLGVIMMVCIIMILNVVVYYPYMLTPLTSSLITLIPLVIFFLPKKHTENTPHEQPFFERSYVLHIFLFTVLEAILLGTVISKQTTEVLPSPWMLIDKPFFILYAITTALLLYILIKRDTVTATILSCMHFFVTSSIAPIIYKLGYGFDGFIHRATETWIAQHGYILPKVPFYIGQYGLVTWLHHMTGMSVKLLDIYLVPIAASIAIPIMIAYALKNTFSMKGGTARAFVWVIPFMYFLSLHLTTPHNVVLLLMILTVAALYSYHVKKMPAIIPLILSLTAVVTHPLLGVPLCAVVIAIIIAQQIRNSAINTIWHIIVFIGIALLPAAMFTTYLLLTHHPMPTFVNPLTHLTDFVSLFKQPHWYMAHAPWPWELLYLWQRIIGIVVAIVGIIGFIAYKKKTTQTYIFPLAMLGFWAAAWLLKTWVVFPDVIAAEQNGYPLRLMTAGLIFMIPFAMYGLYYMGNSIIKKIPAIPAPTWRILFILASAFVLMISLYFSYPQRNPKVWFGGFNVTQYDMDAVKWIHDDNTTDQYVVLSNSITSVAALDTYSFYKYFDTPDGQLFYYAIPTGGPLYEIYQKMLYHGQHRADMIQAMDITHTDKAYFVVNWYWAKFNDIVAGAKQSADSWQSIDDKIYIFTYTR